MPIFLTVNHKGVSPRSLEILASQLRGFGAEVVFDGPLSGRIQSVSGEMVFLHDGDEGLTVSLTRDAGHFPLNLLVGGIRQMIEEAVELLRHNEARS